MRTKTVFWGTTIALALWMSGGEAADISNLSGQSCGALTGTWHFVNNQTQGAAAGTLTATWDSGDSCTVGASTVNKSNQHFYCTASGTLVSASTNLPGRLVLSDFSCETKEPPPCDPKKDPYCK
jgi:hypothetical protein